MVGVQSTAPGGAIQILALGNLTVNDNVSATTGAVQLEARVSNNTLDNNANISTTNAPITLVGNRMTLEDGTVTAGSGGRVILTPFTAARAIDLGSTTDVSATALEFAYSQAPAAMKGAIMAFWSLSVTVGNLWVLLVNAGVRNDAVTGAIEQTGIGVVSFQMFFFAAFAFLAAAAFGLYAMRYRMADHYRPAE